MEYFQNSLPNIFLERDFLHKCDLYHYSVHLYSAQVYQQELRENEDRRALALEERLKFRNLLRRPKSEDYS